MTDIDRLDGDSGLIVALAAGKDVRSAAAQAGVSEATAYRRLREPEFKHRVREVRGLFIDKACGRLSEAACAAVDTLAGLLGDESPTARLGAAKAILELGSRLRESVELEERIAALEGQLSGNEER